MSKPGRESVDIVIDTELLVPGRSRGVPVRREVAGIQWSLTSCVGSNNGADYLNYGKCEALLEPTNGYVIDGRVTVTIDLRVDVFAASNEYSTVRVLVGGRAFYVNDRSLASISPVFRAMLTSIAWRTQVTNISKLGIVDRQPQLEVKIPDKERFEAQRLQADHFLKFILAAHAPTPVIDDRNLNVVFELARRYKAESLVQLCEEYVRASLRPAERLRWALESNNFEAFAFYLNGSTLHNLLVALSFSGLSERVTSRLLDVLPRVVHQTAVEDVHSAMQDAALSEPTKRALREVLEGLGL